jgi:hypothetical protein
MAFATEPILTVSIAVVDASGTRSKVIAHLPSTTDETAALASGVTLAGLVAALTDAEVETVSVTYSSTDTAAVDAVFPGSSVEEKGRFITQAANGSFVRLEIPAIKDAVVDQSGAIPVSDADVIALLNELTGGGWVSAQGSDIVAHHAAYKAYRRSTKGMLPRSRLVS